MSLYERTFNPTQWNGHADANRINIETLAGGDASRLRAAQIKDYARRATIIFGCRDRLKNMTELCRIEKKNKQ